LFGIGRGVSMMSSPAGSLPGPSLSRPPAPQNIRDRFSERAQAERYRDRFRKGRRQRTHARETAALDQLLGSLVPDGVPLALDVACGPGRFVPTLIRYAKRLVQVDASRHMLNLSREDYPMDPGRIYYCQVDALHLPVRDGAVDLLFCHRFLNHVPDPQNRLAIMKELARVTRGHIVVSCLGLPRIVQIARRFYARLKGKNPDHVGVVMEDLIASAAAAGLTLVTKTPILSLVASGTYLTFRK
jgi:SAM-dependent methyltransferase